MVEAGLDLYNHQRRRCEEIGCGVCGVLLHLVLPRSATWGAFTPIISRRQEMGSHLIYRRG
jgi:hypothetical protein